MEDPKPRPSSAGSEGPQSCFWDIFDGLIDRILREDAHLSAQRTQPHTEAIRKGSGLSLPSSHRDAVSIHHQRVSERIRLSKRTYPTHSPYVRRHKIISQLMDINEPGSPVVKHNSRRLRKLRAKPLLDISDWGLSDDSFSEDDAQDDHVTEITDNVPNIKQNDCRSNETTSEVQTSHSAFCDAQNMGDRRTDTSVSSQGNCRMSNATGELASLSSVGEIDINHSQSDSIALQGTISLDEYVTNGSLGQKMERDPNFDKTCKLTVTADNQTSLSSPYDNYESIDNVQSEFDETRQIALKHNAIDDAIRRSAGLEKEYQRFIDKAQTEDNMSSVDGYRFSNDTKDALSNKSEVDKLTNPFEAITVQTSGNSNMQSNMASPQSREGSYPKRYLETNTHSNVHFSSHHGEFPTCSTQSFDVHHTKSTISEHRPLYDSLSSVDNNSEYLIEHPVLEKDDVSQDVEEKRDIVDIGEIDDMEIESILATLLRAQKNFKNVVPSINPEEYQRKLASYMESKKEHNPDGNVSEEDARKVVLLEHLIRFFECKIVEIVKFAKCVPGFKDLCMDDQAALIKVSRTECGMVGGVPMVNTRDKVVHAENNYTLPLQLLGTVVSPRFMDEFFKLCKKIEQANIKEEEGALLRGITITFTDRCKLTEPEKVQTIQNKLVTCLMYVIKRETTTVSPQVRLGQLFEILTCVRNYTDVDSNLLRNTLLEYPNYSGNDLVKEFLDRSQIV